MGERLVSVWLYGSRARGEKPESESDVDLMVVSKAGEKDRALVQRISLDAAVAGGLGPFTFSIQTVEPEWIAGRRKIESFFMQEVDRDKIVLHGEP